MLLNKGEGSAGPFLDMARAGLAEAERRHGIRVVEVAVKYRKPENVFLQQFFVRGVPANSHAAWANFPGGVTAALKKERPDLVLAVGFGDAFDLVVPVARHFSGIRFVAVDFDFMDNLPNTRTVQFAVDEPSVIVGWLAAELSGAGGELAQIGGLPFEGVDRFLVGFDTGARLHAAGVSVLTEYSGGFDAEINRIHTQALLDAHPGTDFIFPVNGGGVFGTAQAIEDSGLDVLMAGVDVDFFELLPETQAARVVTSVLKNMDVGVLLAVEDALAGGPSDGIHLVDMASGAVGLAPFRNFELTPERAAAIESLRAGILDGSIPTGW